DDCCQENLRPMRLRISSKAASPMGMSARELGSGAVTEEKVKLPVASGVAKPRGAMTLVLIPVVLSTILNVVVQKKHIPTDVSQLYESPGRLPESSVIRNVSPPKPMVRVGDGNVTSAAVGGVVQPEPHVKVGVNESA